jgi:hypothetical protein
MGGGEVDLRPGQTTAGGLGLANEHRVEVHAYGAGRLIDRKALVTNPSPNDNGEGGGGRGAPAGGTATGGLGGPDEEEPLFGGLMPSIPGPGIFEDGIGIGVAGSGSGSSATGQDAFGFEDGKEGHGF